MSLPGGGVCVWGGGLGRRVYVRGWAVRVHGNRYASPPFTVLVTH